MVRNSWVLLLCMFVLVCYCQCSTFNVRCSQCARKCTEKEKKINRNEHFLMNERYLTYRMLIRIWPCDKERSLDHICFPWGLLQCDGYNISLYDTLYHFADFETSCYRVAFKMRVQRTQNNWNQWFSASVLQSLIVNVLTWKVVVRH